MDAKLKSRNRTKVNNALHTLGLTYHPSIPLTDIDTILTSNGFNALEEAIYCGREGNSNEPVGYGVYLSLSWYKMPSGRFEVIAYV